MASNNEHSRDGDGDVVLRAENISVRFGGVVAVDRASITVRRGDIVGLIGPNGAGKTSLLNAVSGAVPVKEGTVTFEGRDITSVPLHRRVGLGISRTFQGVELFGSLSTVDNLMLGRHHLMRTGVLAAGLFYGRARAEEIAHRRRVEEIIEFLELEAFRMSPVGSLPFGVQKFISVGRALCAEPRVLLLDEPASGLNHEERRDLARFMLRIKYELGITIVWVEHDVRMVTDLADSVVALHEGRKVGEGSATHVLALDQVKQAFLGETEAARGDSAAAEQPSHEAPRDIASARTPPSGVEG